MNHDSRKLLSLVATGRMTAAEAERWRAASREENLDRSETRWILAALAVTVFMQMGPLLDGLRHIASLLIGRV
jgi:hypothetical protein